MEEFIFIFFIWIVHDIVNVWHMTLCLVYGKCPPKEIIIQLFSWPNTFVGLVKHVGDSPLKFAIFCIFVAHVKVITLLVANQSIGICHMGAFVGVLGHSSCWINWINTRSIGTYWLLTTNILCVLIGCHQHMCVLTWCHCQILWMLIGCWYCW